MEYHEAADFLFRLRRFRPKPGTESTARLLASVGNPHETLECVQIAGSNGKGSTARMLERSLREAGYSVGLYTSPHLEDVRERIRVDGRKISRAGVCEYVEAVREYIADRGADGESPTFFETMTALSLWYFDREDVDIAILEVGIGGRYDATSVVDPIASTVTNVTLEHTGILGETEAEIAHDKAHVAPGDAPLVTGVTGDALEAVREVAGEVVTVADSSAEWADTADVRVEYGGRTNHAEAAVSIDADDWSLETQIPHLGPHQATNAGIAATLARQIGGVSDTDLARGLRNAHWPGRFEVMETEPLVVLDGAHNPGACRPLAATLESYEYDDLHLVFGAMYDKAHREMAAALPTPASVVATKPDLQRAEDPAVLAAVFDDAGAGEVTTTASVEDALTTAIERAEDDDCVLVTGSLFVVADARSRWTTTGIPKRIRSRADAKKALEGTNAPTSNDRHRRGDAVHHVLKTTVQPRQAATLKTALLRLGGECTVADYREADERVETLLMGTQGQFERLIATLEKRRDVKSVAEELRSVLDSDTEPTAGAQTRLPWHDRTAVMGILNITPDSFHDGGEYDAVDDAISRAEAMVDAGVDILDVGGESTRPGADPVSIDEEIDRVVPVIERLSDLEVPISIDTRKAPVADAALEAGADIVNDVSGLEDPEMRFVVADHDAALIVMHSIDTPVVPGRDIEYDDVVEDVIDQLTERLLLAEKAGIDREKLVVDPGLGFGKSARESFELLGRLEEFAALGCPVLVGHSHKSMFGHVDRDADDRLEATVAATAIAADRGADIVRVHDVPENVAAVRTALAARDPDQFEW